MRSACFQACCHKPTHGNGWAYRAALILAAWLAGTLPAHADDWKYDVLHLKNGHDLAGLLVEETGSIVRFDWIRRRSGQSTLVIPTTFRPAEIDHIDRLTEADRKALAVRVRALDPSGQRESARMERLALRHVPWIRKGGGDALAFSSDHFTLLSNAREDIVRRAAVRLEQVYRAYARYLPPRQRSGKPTQIVLFRSLDDYQGYLKEDGDHVLNPAFYDPDTNRILCASNLERLGQQLADARKHHRQMLADLKKREADWRKQNRGRLAPALADYLHRQRVRIDATNRRNSRVFDRATEHLFQTLYHEAFHAYLDNFVYPHRTATVPRWLNEGLAQIFQAGIVEAGEVRVGAADPDRLDRLQRAFTKNTALSLADVLRSGFNQFVVARAGDQATSSRYYLHSWALAHYLMFERKLLGTPALDRYVQALHRHADPLAAFRDLVGKPLPEFEKGFRDYVRRLQPDGTVAARPAP